MVAVVVGYYFIEINKRDIQIKESDLLKLI